MVTGHIKVPLELPDIGSKTAGLMTQNPTLGNDLQWRWNRNKRMVQTLQKVEVSKYMSNDNGTKICVH